MTGPPSSSRSVDEQATALLRRARRLADGPLAGIEDAARQLAGAARGDLSVLARARRLALAAADRSNERRDRQVVALLRRALEVGHWCWDDQSNRWSWDEGSGDTPL